MSWDTVLAVTLVANATVGFGYRLYRVGRGDPIYDAIGQAILGALLLILAGLLVAGAGWPRWAALGYGVVFGLLVMPLWVLAVLIPMRPGRMDVAFTVVYWAALAVTVVAAIAA